MRRTITIKHLSAVQEVLQPRQRVTYAMRHAETHYWEHEGNLIAEQTFDGRYAYLYYFEFWINQATNVTCSSHAPDLHLCYPIQLDNKVLSLNDHQHNITIKLIQERASYLYLAQADFQVSLPVGHYIIRGITLDSGLFRTHFERRYAFAMPLVHAKRAGHSISMQSVDFIMDKLTKYELDAILLKINPKVMDNEHVLIRHQIFLIDLSRLKIMMEDGSITTPLAVIKHARELLRLTVHQCGNKAMIQDIAETVHIDRSRLYKLHKTHFNCSLLTYRNELLVEKILSLYDHFPDNLAELAYEMNFSGLSELNRFFKKMKGKSLKQYQKH